MTIAIKLNPDIRGRGYSVMNARDNLQTILIVVQDCSALRIANLLSVDDHDHFETTLAEGESFGGRSYDEWLAIARGPGRVDADWLQV